MNQSRELGNFPDENGGWYSCAPKHVGKPSIYHSLPRKTESPTNPIFGALYGISEASD